jgi:FkbM family methyltransferase
MPGWGILYDLAVGSYRRDWFWSNSAPKIIQNKITGYITELDISRWADRQHYFLGRWHDLEAQLLLKQVIRSGDLIIDVGANRGNFTMVAASLTGPAGHVVAFEPQPSMVAKIRRGLDNNRVRHVTVYQMGLSDAEGQLTLNVPAVNSGEASFGPLGYKDQRSIAVSVGRGDDVLKSHAAPRLIKIDVEGFEIPVLRGFRETIQRAKPIIVTEVVASHLERCGYSRKELFESLKQLGYSPFQPQASRRATKLVFGQASQDQDGDLVWLPSGLRPEDL